MKPTAFESVARLIVRWAMPVAGCCFLAGCSLDPFGAKKEVREVRTGTREDIRITQGDIQRLREEVDNLSARFDQFSAAQERDMLDLKRRVSGLESQVAQGNKVVLEEVDRRIAEVDAKRVADKNQLAAKLNDVIDQVNSVARRLQSLSSSRPSGDGTVSAKGIEYTVEDGDSLWGIASKFKKFGVTVDAIRQANNMRPTDNRIVPGQVLFIPVKE
jgi:nucleoid-associated protein YgaU